MDKQTKYILSYNGEPMRDVEFLQMPSVGDFIKTRDKEFVKIINIIHRFDGVQPFIEVEVNKNIGTDWLYAIDFFNFKISSLESKFNIWNNLFTKFHENRYSYYPISKFILFLDESKIDGIGLKTKAYMKSIYKQSKINLKSK